MVNYSTRQESAYVAGVRVTMAVETTEGAMSLLFGSPYSRNPNAVFLTPDESRVLKESTGARGAQDLAGKLLKGIVKRSGSRERVMGLL